MKGCVRRLCHPRFIRELSGAIWSGPDRAHPLLHRLERHGYAQSSKADVRGGRRRKHYTLTDAGRRTLAENDRTNGSW